MNQSVAVEAGELALVHTAWTMNFPDERVAEGATAEVLRCQPDRSWKFIIDNPDGSGLISHDLSIHGRDTRPDVPLGVGAPVG
jgi:hypothetical protein